MNTTTLLFHAVSRNAREHPLSAALLYLYCPAAAYWWRAGVEIAPPHDPVWQAVEDYSATPPRTLREYLVAYGLQSLLDDAKRYVEQVTAARQRLPHVRAPELLPTFPGGKLPLRKRFGIKEALEHIGGADGFFSYVRTWAFLIGDWLTQVHYPNITLETAEVSVAFAGVKRPYRMPAWFIRYQHQDSNVSPPGIGIPASVPFAATVLYYFAQSQSKTAWKQQPQLWLFYPTGEIAPLDPLVSPDDMAAALLKVAAIASKEEAPYPLGSMASPDKCRFCPFKEVCFQDLSWTPQAMRWVKEGLEV